MLCMIVHTTYVYRMHVYHTAQRICGLDNLNNNVHNNLYECKRTEYHMIKTIQICSLCIG